MVQSIFLASQSPRRAELLAQMGVAFVRLKVDVPEVRGENEEAKAYVQRLAIEKAQAGANVKVGEIVLGADTIVECDGLVLEKPRNQKHAAEMLGRLSNNTHYVHTAVAIARGLGVQSVCVTTEVKFRAITTVEMADYWHTGEPADKAGGYGIQGFGGVFVDHIAGSYSAVVGLPVAQTQQLLAQLGVPCWQSAT